MQKDITKIIIAIDGHSSCGKSTLAKDLSRLLRLTYIDTGAMYRAVTLFSLRNNLITDGVVDANELHNRIGEVQIELKKNLHTAKVETYLNGENVEETIRSLEVSSHVSTISTLAFVRKRLVELQQEMGNKGGIVMDGRDIGTVVFPNAHLKLFMTASAEIRAQRRYDEMIQKGDEVTFEEILENVVTRDRIDSTRVESPLKQADDALVLDNSHITPQEQLAWILKQLEEQGWI
jgi:cytidylate kinase